MGKKRRNKRKLTVINHKTEPMATKQNKVMPNLSRERIEYLKKVLSVQTASYKQQAMLDFIEEEWNLFDDDSIQMYNLDDNLYITKGVANTYPCVVAHMDTVHFLCEKFKIFEDRDVLFSMDTGNYNRTGIGGDDKAGVFIALEMLKKFDNIKIAFFRDEEVGCVGSGLADMEFFEDVSFVLEADRKGIDDFVNSISSVSLYGEEFATIIKPVLDHYGRKEVSGGLTDVKALVENKIGVCVANASCGYYFPHTDNEIVIISEVLATSDMFADLITTLHKDGKRYLYTAPPKPVYDYSYGKEYWKNRTTHHSERDWDSYYDVYDKGDKPAIKQSLSEPKDTTPSMNSLVGHDASRILGVVCCDECGGDITSEYDAWEDGYYCFNCMDYRFLEHEEDAPLTEQPDSNIIYNKINNLKLGKA